MMLWVGVDGAGSEAALLDMARGDAEDAEASVVEMWLAADAPAR